MRRTSTYMIAVSLMMGICFCGSTAGTAQAQSRIPLLDESTVVVDGTSNQSDWSVTADSVSGWVTLADGAGAYPTVAAVELRVLADQIKSGRSPIMDRLAHRALKSAENNEIVFELTSAETQSVDGASADSFRVAAAGNLSVAGVTHEIQTDVGGLLLDDGRALFRGAYEMKMTDYGMTPPTALFGALHTGDAVVVKFDFFIDLN